MDDPNDGGLIYFKKRKSDIKWDKNLEREGLTGHPPYAEWFCKKHYPRAKELENLTIDEAIKLLKS